ncbi:MAG: helix-turn-helix transcriptional regulator [Fermentimonas sp.]|nr:helix-turn-helix transcriptional regulator [Fermentimonas sp.]
MVPKRDRMRDGALLRGFRLGANMTQVEAAKLTRLSVTRISLIERGLEEEPQYYFNMARGLGLSAKKLRMYVKSKKVS